MIGPLSEQRLGADEIENFDFRLKIHDFGGFRTSRPHSICYNTALIRQDLISQILKTIYSSDKVAP